MWPNEAGQNRETDEKHDEYRVAKGFQSWGTVVSLFEMDNNWN